MNQIVLIFSINFYYVFGDRNLCGRNQYGEFSMSVFLCRISLKINMKMLQRTVKEGSVHINFPYIFRVHRKTVFTIRLIIFAIPRNVKISFVVSKLIIGISNFVRNLEFVMIHSSSDKIQYRLIRGIS